MRWFRAIGGTWREHVQVRREIAGALDARLEARPGPGLCVVLPVYTRPQNLPLSVALALRTPGVEEVRVCLNDPRLEWRGRLDPAEARDPRLIVERAESRRGPVERYRSAERSSSAHFASLDDDVFLAPGALRGLADHLRAAPSRAHGFYGQRVDERTGRYSQNLCRRAGAVSVLNRAYAFTAAHVERYVALLEGLSERDPIAIDDDVVLSFCGEALPEVHDLGPWLDCPSETDKRIARFGRQDAASRRRALFEELAERVGVPPAAVGLARDPRFSWAPRTPLGAGLYYASGLPLLRRAARALRPA